MLLAAGKRSGDLAAALLQAGELLKHALHVALNIAALAGERAHVQIFLNGHLQEHPASLRDQCKPLGDDLVAGNVVQGLAHEVDMGQSCSRSRQAMVFSVVGLTGHRWRRSE